MWQRSLLTGGDKRVMQVRMNNLKQDVVASQRRRHREIMQECGLAYDQLTVGTSHDQTGMTCG